MGYDFTHPAILLQIMTTKRPSSQKTDPLGVKIALATGSVALTIVGSGLVARHDAALAAAKADEAAQSTPFSLTLYEIPTVTAPDWSTLPTITPMPTITPTPVPSQTPLPTATATPIPPTATSVPVVIQPTSVPVIIQPPPVTTTRSSR